MKLYINIDDPARQALSHSLALFGFEDKVESFDEADVVFVDSIKNIAGMYSEDKHYIIVSLIAPATIPKNAAWFNSAKDLVPLASHLEQLQGQLDTEGSKSKLIHGQEYTPTDPSDHPLHILIVDDNDDNLRDGLTLLGDSHCVTLAGGYGQAADLIDTNAYDVVLSDCQMPVDLYHSALSPDYLDFETVVHNGLFLMFKATKAGCRFAIVTNANHHQDWVSAVFDDLKEPHIVNGFPVMFFNYIGKRWDVALGTLMSVDIAS